MRAKGGPEKSGIMNMNNRKRQGRILLFLLALFTASVLFGCGGATGNEDTPDITPEYLSGAYAEQLINDGAELLLGSIELTKEESGEIQIILHPKEIVADDHSESGYRIDSFALNRTFILPEQAYVTYLADGETTDPQVVAPDVFYETLTEDYKAQGLSFAEYGDHMLYDVYALDDQALLVMAHIIQ